MLADYSIPRDLFYQDCAGTFGYRPIDFALEELCWFGSNLEHEVQIFADRIKRREAEKLHNKGLISDYQYLMTKTYTSFVGIYPYDWRKAHKASR